MPLNEVGEIITWPSTHYLCVEKVGPFSETAGAAWGQLHGVYLPQLRTRGDFQIQTLFALYELEPHWRYRAGVAISGPPIDPLPEGLTYMNFSGGKYRRYILTGPYKQLPEACGRVFDLVHTLPEGEGTPKKEDAIYGEVYVTDPSTTPEDELVTHILVPWS